MRQCRVMRWLWYVLSTLAVVAAAAAPFAEPLRSEVRGWFQEEAEAGGDDAPGPPPVAAEQQYYLMLASLEVSPKDSDGDKWDSDGSGPDLYYEVFWQGQKVFESSTKDDTLVAKWSSSAIRIGDLFEAVSVDDSIKAARMTARAGQPLEIAVFDKDLGSDDEVARWSVDPLTLAVTDQRIAKPCPGIVSAVLRVLALDEVQLDDMVK